MKTQKFTNKALRITNQKSNKMKSVISLLSIFIFTLFTFQISATNVNVESAKNVGKNFYWENEGASKNLHYDQIDLEMFSSKMMNGKIVYYIFNVTGNNGFVIVSADDAVLPIIGYTSSGLYTGQKVPGGLSGLLEAHAQTISEVISKNLKSPPEITAKWEQYKSFNPNPSNPKAISPLLATTWDQGCSYNDSCPSINSYYDACNHAWAGCGAAAMAQILKYYSYPSSGIGSHSYQDEFPNGSGNYVTAKANFGATTYHYSQMSNYMYWPGTDSKIAQLMYHCAVAINMDFDTTISVSYQNNILAGFKNYFGYPGGAHWEFMSNTTSWKTKIKYEMGLNSGRPLYYWGSDINDNAHYWVCDGYNNSDMFHMNWAVFNYWPNPNWPQPINYDGYFYITSLAPYTGAPNFSYQQGAIFGMVPYCTASSQSGDSTQILSVQLNTIYGGGSAWNGYTDYKSQFNTNLSRGGIYGVRIFVRYTFNPQPTLCSGFVDWNQDGDFLDSGESFGLNFSYDYTQVHGGQPMRYFGVFEANVYVPANALLGSTPFRVRTNPTSYGYNPPCGISPHGEVEDYLVTVVAGNQAPQPGMPFVFSLDIGSDTELSDTQADGDELFDPGDCYYYDGTILPIGGMDGYINDQPLVGGRDPYPSAQGLRAPIGNGWLPYASFFDMDGVDILTTDLSMFNGYFPIPEFPDSLISTPDHVFISFDDDTAPNYADTLGSVPVSSSSPTTSSIYGTTSNKDEIIEMDFSASTATSFPISLINSGGVSDEASLHPQLAPNPDAGNADDDDVDALDKKYNIPPGTGITYFSVDHEATYLDPVSNSPLWPGDIYEYFGSGTGAPYFGLAVYSGQMGLYPETDIDAFEFVWLWNDQMQFNALAILFSIDDDDPLTIGVDESGGMDPKQLYYSFMDGMNFPFSIEPFEEDIDAITTSESSYLAQAVPPSWQFTPTNVSHLISIPVSVNPIINGTPLSTGDLVGVFYTDLLGNEKCGGYTAWDGANNIAVVAYGDDLTTPLKDGYVNGEILTWKVYSFFTLSSFPMLATYDQTMPHIDGKYTDWGISSLTGLSPALTQSLTIYQGWKGISSYVVPTNPNLDTLLAPVQSKLIIMQNFSGVYWPSAGVNTLINWNVYDGYVVKMSQDTVLNIQGTAVSNRTINLTPGWHLVPVLSSNAIAASSLFNIPEVMLVKEVAGSKVYWPTMGINSLSVLKPGETYYVYVLSPVSISYPAKSAPAGNSKNIPQANISSPWTTVSPTPNSHLVAIPESISIGFSEGTILGAFNKNGLCVGFTPIIGKDDILTIYGDDITTPEVDGMNEYEDITYKLYNPATGEDEILNPVFDTEKLDAGSTFKINGLSILKSITSLKEITTFGNLSIYPNPASNYIKVNLGDATPSVATIELMNIIGDIMVKLTSNNATEIIDVSGLAGGCYIIRVSNHSETISKKIVIRK